VCNIPSKCTHNDWIFAFSPTYAGKELTEIHVRLMEKARKLEKGELKTGKWLIFVDRKNVDKVWEKIRLATEKGALGIEAKVSSKIAAQLSSESGSHVICVYTYDWTDERDVRRVREELRKLGITNKIPYKADVDTIQGRYRALGHTKISKYYE